ncbi:glycoside hydrolase [Acephala macrosclerotiorum]|nr:glycoside hydrolase [Acephala macrosclerotiorum]
MKLLHSFVRNWGTTKVQGVSLEGWLLHHTLPLHLADPTVIDEWTFTQTLGKHEALKRLKKHWDTWVTLPNFKKIKKAGLNVVRFGDPFVQGAAPHIDKAIIWVRATGLKIILDLHGAPKSQNGWEHSGHKMPAPGWGDADFVAKTLQVLTTMSKYAQAQYQDVIIAIELLNESFLSMLDPNTVRSFYTSGYNIIRGSSDTPTMIHDGFWDPAYWNGFLTWSGSKAYNVIVDHHEYQIFDPNLNAMSPAQHLAQVCSSSKAFANSDKWEIVGEWSAGMTDCGPCWPIGSCAGRSDISTWTPQMKSGTRKYIEAQMDSYESRTELNAEWDLYALIAAGVFPQPLSARQFLGDVCP